MRIVLKPMGALILIVIMLALSGIVIYESMPGRSRTATSETAVATASAGTPSEHLVAYWKFDEGSGHSAADASGHGNTVTLGDAASWGDGRIGAHSLNLTGAGGSEAEVSKPVVDTTQSYTVAAWVKVHKVAGFQTFVGIDGAKVSGFFLQLRDDSKRFTFAILPKDDPEPNTPVQAVGKDLPEAERWYHLVGVYDAEAHTSALYVDGVLQQSSSLTSPTWKASGATAIGRGRFNSTPLDGVSGEIDDVRFYDIALPAADILDLAKTAK